MRSLHFLLISQTAVTQGETCLNARVEVHYGVTTALMVAPGFALINDA
ncbi:hypothetical protein [Enterobacter mori]